MEFVKKPEGFSDKEEEDEEEDEEIGNFACNFFPQTQIQTPETSHSSYSHGKLQLTDLSLRIDSSGGDGGGCGGSTGFVQREPMFHKVVTPSDVGKLNRLVIPKQHAEKYFPLDSSNDKGLILNFEDPNGKSWRFRYSYWNSSQSYVMTKGWSRFVKEKKLDAGDIVSFERGAAAKDRFFIDWRRRSDAPTATANPLLLLPPSVRWSGGRHYTVPQTSAVPPQRRSHLHQHFPHMMYSSEMVNLGSNSLYYLQPSVSSYRMGAMQQYREENQASSMAINNISTAVGTATAAKRLRLFGVNMECPATEEEDDQFSRRGKKPSSFNGDF